MNDRCPLYDAHNHLQDDGLAPYRADVLAQLTAVGVERCVVNGTSEADWPSVAELAARSPLVVPSFGLHPWDVGNRSPDWQANLLRQLDTNPSAGVGEIGLDRWILDHARPNDARLEGLRRAPLPEQADVMHWQLTVAVTRNLPTTIHCLEAFGALHDALRSRPLPARGFLLHAYSGSAEMARSFAKLGAYFSFNGAFLDPRKERLRAVYAALPVDRLLVETDAPAMRLPSMHERFLVPATSQGQTANHPANIVVAYEELAKIRGVTTEALARQVAENFDRLFGVT
ncbi:MAG: TatD family hydrolase [Opitutus sp.]